MKLRNYFGAIGLITCIIATFSATSVMASEVQGVTVKQICKRYTAMHPGWDCYVYANHTSMPLIIHSANWLNNSKVVYPGQCLVDPGQPMADMVDIHNADASGNAGGITSATPQHATDSQMTNQASVITFKSKQHIALLAITDYQRLIPTGACHD